MQREWPWRSTPCSCGQEVGEVGDCNVHSGLFDGSIKALKLPQGVSRVVES